MSENTNEEQEELLSQVYQLVNDTRDVPEIAKRIFGESTEIGSPDFFKVCDAVDKLIDKGWVYFRSSDGVLLDLQR